ncbi:MAG TPA: metabolite traffic protein EboE [Kofleriaceae bacterium]|nr:metabolite traffic protein EboE [Kofleriaceae bacterium]
MRLALPDGRAALLCYCGNVHPGERLDDLWRALDVAASVRRELALERMGFGLWLGRSALTQLGAAGGAARLRDELAARGLEVTTMNGFPYGNFHADVVKRAVYHPDWSTFERFAYTTELAELLAALLPEDAPGGTLSTLPLAHAGEAGADPDGLAERAAEALCRAAAALARLADATGKQIRLCVEPEPGCLIETTAQAIRLWTELLPRAAVRAGVAMDAARAHLGLCYDTCHQAVAFEQAAASLDALAAAGVPIGKVQLSSALELAEPDGPAGRELLARFAEPRFLHQVRAPLGGGALAGVDDLYPDLAGLDALPADRPWRIHFHLPIHREVVGEIATTRGFLEEVIAHLVGGGRPLPQLEVETYTWAVLPGDERPSGAAALARGIAAELAWARGEVLR